MNTRSPRFSTLGRPRSLTDAQVAEILAWREQRMTLVQKARSLGISCTTLRTLLVSRGAHYVPRDPAHPRCGRPPALTDRLIAEVIAWNAQRLTRAQLAQRMGISVSVIGRVITYRGIYKQASPELRRSTLDARSVHVAELKARYLL